MWEFHFTRYGAWNNHMESGLHGWSTKYRPVLLGLSSLLDLITPCILYATHQSKSLYEHLAHQLPKAVIACRSEQDPNTLDLAVMD